MSDTITGKSLIYAEESLIADVQFAIHNLLEAKGVSRADLARLLQVSDARISQIFKDEAKNLTLRTIARIFHVLGEEAQITSITLDEILPKRHRKNAPQPAGTPEKDDCAMMLAWLHEADRAREAFMSEANDNIVEEELVA